MTRSLLALLAILPIGVACAQDREPATGRQITVPAPLIPNPSLVFPATIGNTSTPLFTGGTAPHNLIVFNNSAPNSTWLWCNPSGGAATPGAGVVIPPGGGAYSWDFGITTVPNCISGTQTGAASSSSVNVSGAGG